jgi:hypothetical protein
MRWCWLLYCTATVVGTYAAVGVAYLQLLYTYNSCCTVQPIITSTSRGAAYSKHVFAHHSTPTAVYLQQYNYSSCYVEISCWVSSFACLFVHTVNKLILIDLYGVILHIGLLGMRVIESPHVLDEVRYAS